MIHDFSILEVVAQGGWTLVVLFLLSVLALAVTYDRWKAFRAVRGSREDVLDAVRPPLSKNDTAGALEALASFRSLPARVACAGLSTKNRKAGDPAAAMEREARAAFLELERRLPVLGTLGNLAPFVGLFGTVLGIIRAFRDLALAEAGGAAVVSQGIAEALLATAAGLFVAILASVAFNAFQSSLDRRAAEVEMLISELKEYWN